MISHSPGLFLRRNVNRLNELLIVDTVSQRVSKQAQGPLASIAHSLLLGLLESRPFALVLTNSKSHILVKRSVLEGHSHNSSDAALESGTAAYGLDKVENHVGDRGAPPVEAKDPVG